MDVITNKWRSNTDITQKIPLQSKSTPSHNKMHETNVSMSSLASKLTKAQSSIEYAQLNQQTLSWERSDLDLNIKGNSNSVASAKIEFEQLSKTQLETIALDPSNTFTASEKLAAYEQWHTLDQVELSSLKREALADHSTTDAMVSFENSLLSHTDSFSDLSKAMISSDYNSQASAQFKSTLNELGLTTTDDNSQFEHYYEVMVERIFGGNEPPVQSGVTTENLLKIPAEFLTQEDRDTIAGMFQYADENDIDTHYIMLLAFDLGGYRQFDNGEMLGSYNGNHFDSEGHLLSISFTDEDQTTIDNLFASDALSSTSLDKGFISFITDSASGTGALSHAGSYEFLQHMVEVTAGVETSATPNEFTEFTRAEERYVITASEEVVLHRVEPDIVCKNGHCEVTEKGRENGVTLKGENNNFTPEFDLQADFLESFLQRKINTETKEETWFKWFM
ncbi:hypothetical protein [uncultured Psychrosphaera sp.]|uniref:hypothetical protein n=1 Tax=uncultured Psychrosphaera sp. TaxID=1403522 RepID=UPI0026312D78|nr:hypothetical protein [uncultured Psychrosphaera sp.]